jgi:8-oxo-dGTP pyrophosphatase MutT (NUDIX family)
MGFLDHLRACNAFRAEQFVPLVLGSARIGLVRRDNAALLGRFPEVFAVADDAVAIVASGGFDALTEAVDGVIDTLVAEGRVEKWRHEFFAVTPRWLAPAVFKIDRGAVAFFGIRSYGVHLNGWRRGDGAPLLWIGKRAADKKVAPGKLDNMVAGGIGFGHGAFETLAKEAAEEAALPRAIIERALPVGALRYRTEVKHGVRDDVLFVYDLEVPDDFVPRNTDGEIAEFRLMPAREVIDRVRRGDDFKFNVNLVLIDFALRHGLLGPENEPDYLDLATGLRRPLD